MIPTVYIGDTCVIDFQFKWSDGNVQDITGAEIWVAVRSAKAAPGSAPLLVRSNPAAGGEAGFVTTTDATQGKFTAFLWPSLLATLVDGEEYIYGAVVRLSGGIIEQQIGVGRFIASARLPVTLS
jgi:hypothetical protein